MSFSSHLPEPKTSQHEYDLKSTHISLSSLLSVLSSESQPDLSFLLLTIIMGIMNG